MTVKELVNQYQTFTGKIYVYSEEVGYNLEFSVDDDDYEILSNAEVTNYELNYNNLYIEIK